MFRVKRQNPWLLSTCIFLSTFAATAVSTNSNWSLRVWQSDDGLPNNKVTGIAQTPDGYLWIATPTRLSRFDGEKFEIVSRDTFAPGTSQRTSTLLRSRDGGLWLAMDHGPIIYAKSGATTFFTNNLPDENVQSLVEDGDGSLWIVYRGGTVCHLQNAKISRFSGTNGLPSGTQCSLACDGKNQLWFAKGGQIGIFRDDRFEPRFPVAAPTIATSLAPARAGGIWICAGHQLFKLDAVGGPKAIGAFQPELADARPTVLLEDRRGGIWIGTSDSGLFHFDGTQFENIATSHREILSLFEDGEGNLWAGTDGGGLDEIQPRAIALENTATGLPMDSLGSICEDAGGNVWATTENGSLVCRSNGVWQNISAQKDWPGGFANCVTADKSGAVWIGTQNFALYRFRDGTFIAWKAADGLTSHTVHALLAAANGDLWIGGNAPESLQRLRNGQFKTFTLPKRIGVIRALAEDPAGNIWIGSTRGALLRVRGDELEQNGLVTHSIRCLCPTPDGSIWIGHAGWGLGRLKDGNLQNISSDRGLFDDYISQIVFDGNGSLWFGADHGIFKIREQDLNAAIGNTNARVQSIHFGRDESLPSLQANFDESPNCWRTRVGTILLPMSSALAIVHPNESRENSAPPPVLLTRVLMDDALAASYGGATPAAAKLDLQNPKLKIDLSPGRHRLEIDFAAICLTAPENVAVQYKLHGFEDRWNDAGSQRAAIYSQLPAGSYQFDARARNGDGDWNERAPALAISVAPFFWQTNWFRFLTIAFAAIILVALVRYLSFRRLQLRIRSLEQQAALDRERARIARDLHDHLGGSLTQMTLQMELALRTGAKPEKIEAHVQKSLSAARLAIQSLDETVWAVNPGNDTLPHLVNYIGEYAVEFLDNAGIRCRVELPEQLPSQSVPADVRHNLFLAIKESLNNVVRHANASEVFLAAEIRNGSLKFSIADNGCGFDSAENKLCADGLKNMRRRMSEIGGEFQIESANSGTKISFVCPWRNGHG